MVCSESCLLQVHIFYLYEKGGYSMVSGVASRQDSIALLSAMVSSGWKLVFYVDQISWGINGHGWQVISKRF